MGYEKMKGQLLAKMWQHHGEHGIYAAQMLETARLMLDQQGRYPRQAEAAAYCIRQAVVEIFGDTKDNREPLAAVVKRVASAKDNIRTTDATDEETLQTLYREVDNLRDRVCHPNREARIKEIFRRSSGIDPVDGPNSLVRVYRKVVSKSNDLLHRISETPADADMVRDHYEVVVDILSLIFLPTVRLARIEQLAELSEPQKSDLEKLRGTMKNAYDFDHFASKMCSSAWFDIIDSNMLKSTTGDPPWLLSSLVWHLKDTHKGAFIRMVNRNFDQWVRDAKFGELGFVGYKLGDLGLPLLVKTLKASRNVRSELDKEMWACTSTDPTDQRFVNAKRRSDSIWHLDKHALCMFLKTKQPSPELIKLAEHLLKPDSQIDSYYKTDKIPDKLVECVTRLHAIHIVKILVRELRTSLQNSSYFPVYLLDAINKPDYDRSLFANGLVKSLHEAILKARDLGVPTPHLIKVLDNLPRVAKPKFETWLYSRADDVTASELVRYLVDSCRNRYPNAEDSLLLDRLKRDGHMVDITKQISDLLGQPPDTEKMVGCTPQWGISREEIWHILWARKLRPWVVLPDEWKPCLDIIDGIGVECSYGGKQESEVSRGQDSTATLGEHGTGDPLEVATKIAFKKPDDGFLELMGGRSPILDLENAVRNNTSKWVENPVEVVRTLHHPEYVAVYFRGLANAVKDLTPYADRLIAAITFACTCQQGEGISGSSTFRHADRYASVIVAGMKLIEEMVKNNVNLDKNSLSNVWSIVNEIVVLPDPETNEQSNYSIEYLNTIDDLPHVRAVRMLFEMIRYAKQNKTEVPKMALARLTEAVRLTGQYGVDYHACIGPWAGFIHVVEPEWFEQNEQYLFGSAASAELGRVALDMYLMWYQPDAFILEKYRDRVLDAVGRNVPRALVHLLHGLLWGTHGYDPKYIAIKLMKIKPKYVSRMVWYVYKLLPEDASADHIQRVTKFWNSALEQSPKQAVLTRFGWWADVPGIEQKQWEKLMLRTWDMAEKLEWSPRVAERVSTSPTITDTGWRILARLINIDLGYEKPEAARHAIDALRKTVDIADAPKSRSHLRDVLVEHGYHDALKL